MRDIVVTLMVLVGWLYTVNKPYIGILLWSWLSYMNPHRLTYGFAFDMPFAQITALVLLGAMLFSKQVNKPPINSITIIWLLFIVLMGVTTVFAFFIDAALLQYIRVLKIQLVVFITMMLITDQKKIDQLLLVIVLSIGYFSVKGGVFTILTGGGARVWGPTDSFIEGNNELGVATLMIIPFMTYFYKFSEGFWLKKGILVALILSFIGALGTQSRGALLATLAVLMFFWIKSEKKILIGSVMLVLSSLILAFMPDSWYQRMDTIQNYGEDASAMGRINAWEYAFNVANENIFGMGFDSWSPITFALYAPNPNDVHAAHSIYFSVLADHGWFGLVLFITIFYLAWRKLNSFVNKTNSNEEFVKINFLAKMLQIGFIAYFVGGAFLSLAYFDLPWHFVSFVILLDICRNNHIKV